MLIFNFTASKFYQVFKFIRLPLLVSVTILLLSCEKDDPVTPIDYSIESTPSFELISQNSKGWIEEARYLRDGAPSEEFEYYENGYIKSAKIYATYPQYHLYMEVSRSEDNKPLWSKYYTPERELWFETIYSNGLPSVKKVYSEAGTAIHSYTNGELSSSNFTAADNSSTTRTSFDAAAGTRSVTITANGETILDEVYPYAEQPGDGIYTSTQVPVANPFGTAEIKYMQLNQSFAQSAVWENDTDPIGLLLPYRLFDEFYYPNYGFATKFAVSTDLYQSVIEQYPVTENGVLIGGGKYEAGYDFSQMDWEVQDSLAKVYAEDPELYELKYGNEYIGKVGYGKIYFIIGAIRNLPTASDVADKVKNIAYRKMQAMISSSPDITEEEQKILDKVWFEVKFFSTLKQHVNGVVITSPEDYNQAVQAINDAEVSVIQLLYENVENL